MLFGRRSLLPLLLIAAFAIASCGAPAVIAPTEPEPSAPEPVNAEASEPPAPPDTRARDRKIEYQADLVLGVLHESDADPSLARVTRADVIRSLTLYCEGNPQAREAMPVAGKVTHIYGTLILAAGEKACPDGGKRPEAPEDPFEPVPGSGVFYQASGAGLMSLTMRTPTGSQQHEVSQELRNIDGDPWLKAGSVARPYISVQNRSPKGGRVGCRITVDGRVVAENWSSGRGSIATCSP